MAGRTKSQIKKEFDAVAGKIARLESLKQELSALDTRGFEKEVEEIKSNLKNVNAVSDVQRAVDSLKRKIEGRKAAPVVSSGLKKKISHLEKLVKAKRKVSVKKQLSNQEVEFVKDIPKVEKNIAELKREFAKHISSNKVKVDSGVGIIVDSKFDDFISGIKGELSKKLKEKEMVMDAKLKSKLKASEVVLSQKYKDLVREFQERYKEKVHNELKREVKEKLESEVNKKMQIERGKVIAALINDNAKRIHAEKKKLVSRLESHYEKKGKSLRNALIEENRRVRENLRKQRESLKARLNALAERENKFVQSRDNLKSQIAKEKLDLHNEINRVRAEGKALAEKRRKLVLSEKEVERFNKQKLIGEERMFREKLSKERLIWKNKILDEKADLNKEVERLKAETNKLDEKERRLLKQRKSWRSKLRTGLRKVSGQRKVLSDEERKLSAKMNEKERVLRKELNEGRDLLKKRLNALTERTAKLKRKESQFRDKNMKRSELFRERLSKEKEFLNKELARIDMERQKVIEKEKEKSREILEKQKAENDAKFAKDVEIIKDKMHTELRAKLFEERQRDKEKVRAELAKKEKVLREKLENSYQKRLREEISARGRDLVRRKAEIEKHILSETKRLLS